MGRVLQCPYKTSFFVEAILAHLVDVRELQNTKTHFYMTLHNCTSYTTVDVAFVKAFDLTF
jgi:hypothetical protein